MFEDENLPCEFCSAQGVRCGPKVFAEKARYFHAKADGSADSLHADVYAFPSQTSLRATVELEEPMAYGSHVSDRGPFPGPKYVNARRPIPRNPLAVSLGGFDVPVKSELPAGKLPTFTLVD